MIEQVFDKILQIFKFRTYVKCSCNNYVNVNLYNSELKLHRIGQFHNETGSNLIIYCNGQDK